MQRPVYLCKPPHTTTPINTDTLSSGMSGTIWYLQSLSLRKNLAGNTCVYFSIWFPRPDPRRSRLDASHLVGRIILDPPIESLNPLTLGHVRVSTPTCPDQRRGPRRGRKRGSGLSLARLR
jgi:hypothetical protein